MIVFLIAVAIIILFGTKIDLRKEIGAEYISKERTTCINGIFVILVIASHYTNFASFSWDPIMEGAYLAFRRHSQQLVVATFLFYSGFGMETRIMRKGWPYITTIPTKAFKLLFKFDFAVLLYLLLSYVLGRTYTIKEIVLAFWALKSVGNSNWYIFVIISMYILIFFTFSVLHVNNIRVDSIINVLMYLGFTILFIFVMIKMEFDSVFYNTAVLMPLGAVYALEEEKVRKIINKSPLIYIAAILLALGLYIHEFGLRETGVVHYSLWVVAFMMIVLLITMRVYIGNKILDFFGKHVFSIYIIQRIPMLILDYFGIISEYKYIGLIITIITTVVLALLYERVTGQMLKMIQDGKNGKTRPANA